MRAFRFRAEAALQLRRREHDAALAGLAHAQTAMGLAERRVEEADAAVRDAEDRLDRAVRAPEPGVPIEWYRSWRARCCADRERRADEQRACASQLRDATAAVRETHRRVRALERLREGALAAWAQAARAEEQKTMDALAAVRFVRRKDAL